MLHLWNCLLELLLACHVRLELSMAIQKILHEMLYVLDWMDELKVRIHMATILPILTLTNQVHFL